MCAINYEWNSLLISNITNLFTYKEHQYFKIYTNNFLLYVLFFLCVVLKLSRGDVMVGGGEEYVLKMVILKINWIERILSRVVKDVLFFF